MGLEAEGLPLAGLRPLSAPTGAGLVARGAPGHLAVLPRATPPYLHLLSFVSSPVQVCVCCGGDAGLFLRVALEGRFN